LLVLTAVKTLKTICLRRKF